MKKILFITNIPSPYRIDFFNSLGKVYNLTVWFEKEGREDRIWEIQNLGKNFQYKILDGSIINLFKEFKKNKFDTYILGSYSSFMQIIAIEWLRFTKTPYVISSDGGFVDYEENFLKKKLKTHLISSATYWLSSGLNCTKYLSYYGANLKYVYEYPFSSVKYTKSQLSPIASFDKQKFKVDNNLNKHVILYVGSYVEGKGVDILLKAFKGLDQRNTSLVLIGNGPLVSQYKDTIKEIGIYENVLIKPFLQKDELVIWYKISDIFVSPTRYDVWGLVLNEAITFGLPVITTTSAGAVGNVVINNYNGYVIEKNNVPLLKDRLEKILGNNKIRVKFANNSKRIAEKYTIENMVNVTKNIIDGRDTK